MRIENEFWVSSWNDVKELMALIADGFRMPCGLEFSHEIKKDGTDYYCFIPSDNRIDGCFYISEYYIDDTFSCLDATVNATVTYRDKDYDFTFDGRGMIVNHGKTIKYKYNPEFSYKFQKTQFQSKNPYHLMSMIIDKFWHNVLFHQMKEIGYI